ncbi:MAG: sulfotransferase, partial [Candidatus Krumholzibacteriota bacterium]|nr:sulfotransferase [Candidatus Krumholzibacteriota bacterium]
RNVEEVQNNRTLFEGRYIEVRYEELTRDTRGVLRRLVDFCELNGPDKFIDFLPAQLPNMNHQWGEQLTEEQKSLLHDSIGEFLSKLGY